MNGDRLQPRPIADQCAAALHAFFEFWREGLYASFRSYLASDVVWENVGSASPWGSTMPSRSWRNHEDAMASHNTEVAELHVACVRDGEG
jgi:ketosteroid isomerase-like protein